MLFFDENNPNKYSALKKELVPHDLVYLPDVKYEKKKFGKGDGSYVLAYYDDNFYGESVSVLSYGIGNDPLGVSFEESFNELGIKFLIINMYDGSIDELPVGIACALFFKEHLTPDNFKDHVADLLGEGYMSGILRPNVLILKMDIEGNEYSWLTEENLKILADTFDQFTLEVHGLIEESPEGWIYDEATLEAKNNLQMKVDFFKKLNQHFYLFHIHGNNHAPRYVDFPDSLELTYVNKKIGKSIGISQQRCPDLSVDEPNFDGRPEFILDWWI